VDPQIPSHLRCPHAAWQYRDDQFKGSNLEDLTTNGPMIGATFRW
jgi:hypothetical protein